MTRRLQWAGLTALVALGAWLRFSHLHLLEFKADEAFAAHLALQALRGGPLPAAGLMSSVGVTNPPLFIYLLIPMFFLTTDPAVVSCLIGALGLAAVVVCWQIGRRYYGALTGWVAATFFAVSPWAVIYSRKIWAQDFVPVFATATMWAVHALVVGGRPKAIFWVVMLPLCAAQIHFSGLALTAAVVAIVLLLRPRMDWRFALAGLAVAVLLAVPYLRQQSRTGWAEFRRFAEQRRGRAWQIPKGMTIQPNSGYPLPRRPAEAWIHAVSIQNAGEIEDVLGLSASEAVDRRQIWSGKERRYFSSGVDWLLSLQRWVFVAGLVALAVTAVRAARSSSRPPWFVVGQEHGAWILLLWVLVPVAVFMVAGLWTYLSYYAILYPAHFLVLGAVAERIAGGGGRTAARRWKRLGPVAAVVAVVAAGNVVFMLKFYGFVQEHGGAQGTYGTGLGYKRAAARFLAERADVGRLMAEGRLAQMDELGRLEAPQLDLPFLAMMEQARARGGAELPANVLVLVVDENRTNYDPRRVPQLAAAEQTNFGPMRLVFLPR